MAIVFNILTLTAALTTTSGNFFYNNYGVKHFITLNKPIPIKTTKNIVISINNNTFIYNLTGNTEPGNMEPSNTEPSTVRSNNKENLTININFLNCYFNNNG